MQFSYFSDRKLTGPAEALVRFDIDSIRQMAAAQDGNEPDVWLADPDCYEKNGRTLRDSPAPRLLAYSRSDRILYACDGCNACTRRLSIPLESLTDSELRTFAEDNDLRLDLLERLSNLAGPS